ncbi:hypothetical protein OBBRIDRAFT_833299 [Obba rivulosa]|uniref:O-methyltransferase domain-containing protein n=1 Tax=Obba rivulosa TaxID=1052685 RepID=A0A8E2DLK6_9APHY|nr:hypothetical protein OBBRIDRAFT_833299 [Obba rivulosa]
MKTALVFLLRTITHDCPDDYVRRILSPLRVALAEIPDTAQADTPAPPLPNYGIDDTIDEYHIDFQMMILLNTQERTVPHFGALLESAGWKPSVCAAP